MKNLILNKNIMVKYFSKGISYKKLLEPPIIKSREETIDKIIKDKSSLARFGDGELQLIMHLQHDIGFQKIDENLCKRLKEILMSEEENLLIGLPTYYFDDLDAYVDEARKWFEFIRIKSGLKFYKLLKNKNHVTYYNTNISRFYIDSKNRSNAYNYANKIKKIWQNRDIVIVEGDKTRSGVGNDLYNNAKSINRILAPSENAYTKYDDILKAVTNNVKKDKLILIALGPTATVLAYDLYKMGYQAIDIGHLDIEYEWMLRGSTWKEKVDNKYVNEAGQRDVSECKDEKYLSEIICKVLYEP